MRGNTLWKPRPWLIYRNRRRALDLMDAAGKASPLPALPVAGAACAFRGQYVPSVN